MREVVHTLACLIRNQEDMALADKCFESLARSCPNDLFVLYNQGSLSNDELAAYLARFNLQAEILGEGRGVGHPRGKKACFDHIWARHQDAKFISEIHLDMIFPPGWTEALIDFLQTHDEEPLVCPGILTAQGELHPERRGESVLSNIPVDNLERMNHLLLGLTNNNVLEGWVHPVIHRAEVLKAVGGYDTRFLKGTQGYEDDSLLVGIRYYLGTRRNWKPKCCMQVRVYHATLFQRVTMPDINEAFQLNLRGLIYQYGVKGLMELNAIYPDNELFRNMAEDLLRQL
ncbi:MAG: hypothetical protein AB1510_05680 [Bacillota bacterium]